MLAIEIFRRQKEFALVEAGTLIRQETTPSQECNINVLSPSQECNI